MTHADAISAMRRIPPGRWATYGDVAVNAGGTVGAARAVGNALTAAGDDMELPGWRVFMGNGSVPKMKESPRHTPEWWAGFYECKQRGENLLGRDGEPLPERRVHTF
jgi:alkylated DNA nucleotide flippase Atl1